jgi:hypothetical protein
MLTGFLLWTRVRIPPTPRETFALLSAIITKIVMSREAKVYKFHFIYKTLNIKNGKFYIGMHSTNDLDDGYWGSGDLLRSSIRHHGKEYHVREILEFLPDRASLDLREQEIVNSDLIKDPHCMNLQIGGGSGFGFSEERLKEISLKGQEAFRSKLLDPEFKKKFGDRVKDHNRIKKELGLFKKTTGTTGKTHSEEAKSKIGLANSESQLGERNSQFGTIWVSKDGVSKKIDSSEFCVYELDGWIRGRNAKGNSNRFWVYKDQQKKRVLEKDLDVYISNGWISKKND